MECVRARETVPSFRTCVSASCRQSGRPRSPAPMSLFDRPAGQVPPRRARSHHSRRGPKVSAAWRSRAWEAAPAATVTLDQIICGVRPFSARLVFAKALRTGLLPRIQERLHGLPSRLDAVGPLEQNVVADHAVVAQCLISVAGRDLEIVLIIELHR